jgi:PleD family two-component response regulator
MSNEEAQTEIKSPKKVLIVDDDQDLCELVRTKLVAEGFEAVVAMHPVEGLKLAQELKPDVILLDVLMPDMDGFEFLQKIHQQGWAQNTKIFMLTNVSKMESISEALKGHVVGYFIKSDWSLSDIVKKLKDF